MNRFEKIATVLIPVSFVAGLIAHFSEGPIAEMFIASTPLYLLSLCLVVLFNHRGKDLKFYGSCLFVFVAAMTIEIIGVSTGYPFGQYFYGAALGPKLLGVPWVIGFNWLLLVYAGLVIAEMAIKNSWFAKISLAATLVLLMDFFIEKVAPSWDYWYWESETVPVLNYIAWFVIAFFLQTILDYSNAAKKNKLAVVTFTCMLLYFIATTIFLSN